MGMLRLLLAFSVLANHAEPPLPWLRLWGGTLAVQSFFVISGFYMALVLDTKYIGRPWPFRINRVLRLLPTYWVVLALTLLWLTHRGFDYYAEFFSLDPRAVVLLLVGNATLFLQDLLFFFTHAMNLTADFRTDPQPLWHYLFVPQSWTLSLELYFYMLAPWFARRSTGTLLAIIAAATAARLTTYFTFGFAHDPWIYRLILFEIAFFLAGMVSYRAYKTINWNAYSARSIQIAGGGCLMAFIAAANALRTVPETWLWTGAALLAFLLPSIFSATRKIRIDNAIGELSYPLYLTHMLVIAVVSRYFAEQFFLVLALSLLLSVGLHLIVERPVNVLREWIASRPTVRQRRVEPAIGISDDIPRGAVEVGESAIPSGRC